MVSTLADAVAAAARTYHAVVIVVSSPAVRISNMFIKVLVNFCGSISSVSVATPNQFSIASRPSTTLLALVGFKCVVNRGTHTVRCEYFPENFLVFATKRNSKNLMAANASQIED